jgi:hypothetical protein
MMTLWLWISALALVLSVIGVLLLAAVPSTERASNREVLWVVAICCGAAFIVGLIIKGALSLFGVA